MDQPEPRARHRGYFFHVEPHSLDTIDNVEHETAEGVPIRPSSGRKPTQAVRTPSVRSDSSGEGEAVNQKSGAPGAPETIRSANATGSRRQARMTR
jgi:hypothetical protein